MSGFDAERVNKISQIMPQFSKVAKVGDTVYMGLEGDPLFPYEGVERPKATIEDIEYRNSDTIVTLRQNDGTVTKSSTLSLASDQVWEFDDETFQKVLERERRPEPVMEYEAETSLSSSEMDMKDEIAKLRQELEAEREISRNFHNTMIASLNEMAGDICKLDKNGSTNFCKTLTNEYNKMIESRAEPSYRQAELSEEEVSADDTDFF